MKKTYVILILVTVILLTSTTIVSADAPPGVGPAIKYDEDTMEFWWLTLDGALYYGHYSVLFPNSASGHYTFKGKMELVSGPPLHAVYRWTQVWGGDECRVQAVFAGDVMNYTEQCSPVN